MHRLGKTRKTLNLATVIVLVISLLVNPLVALTAQAGATGMQTMEQREDEPATPGLSSRGTVDAASGKVEKATKSDKATGSDGTVGAASAALDTYIVVLQGAPLASYRGGVAGLAATNPAAQGRKKLDARSPESRAYLGYLEQLQADFISQANKTLGRPLDVLYTYKATVNGFAAKMTAAEAQRLAKLPEVRRVEKERIYELHTDAGPAWIGAPEIWGGGADSLPFGAELSGANEVPPVDTIATGTGTFTYNLNTQELTYNISVSDIDNVTLAHIHPGAVGVNGPPAHTLFDGTGVFDPANPISGIVTLTADEQGLLMNQGLYVNVHTTDFPSGEIRGQIIATGTLGEDIVVGVIDTGIDPFNPSFAATGGDGYTHSNPNGEGNYVGVCDPANTTPPAGVVAYDPTFPCNSKLIGAWGYTSVDDTPRDSNGHGSHTASTAAGNFVHNPVVETPTGSFTVDLISGVAPHANIIAYAACCTGSALQAARDQALLDGVDVINYSIGADSPTPDPYNNVEALSWLALRDAGVFVATSAGNAGPFDASVGAPADLPWLTATGASSHNRVFLSSVTLNDGVNPPLELPGMALTTGYGPAEIVLAVDFAADPAAADAARFCAPGAFPPGTFSGQIVVCERGGDIGRVAKGQTVLAGGAGGMILAQPTEFAGGPGSVTADTHVLPASHIDFYAYQDLLAYLAAAGGPVQATISGGSKVIDNTFADIMGEFSSRGPNGGLFDDIIVPSVTAPGRSIWAAYHQGDGGDGTFTYNVIQGTSMSSPHVAGAGALMKALHPTWTPAEIQSALMSTARTNILNDDGVNQATPFAQGAGRVDLTQAANAGLVLNATTDEYLAADPAAGGDPKNINLASAANTQCLLTCSWTRTVKSTLDAPETWTVAGTTSNGVNITAQPSQFTLEPGATQAIVITADATAAAQDEWLFGEVQLTPAGAAPAAHFPVALVSTPSILPDSVDIHTRRDAGSQAVTGLQAIEITDLTVTTHGLVGGEQHELLLNEDPTNGDPYDNVGDGTVEVVLVNVPAGALRLVANIIDSSAPDIDLYVGTGDTPSLDTEVCISATGTSQESCVIDFPAAGTWWILVQNWEASDLPPDFVVLSHAVVVGDNGNLTVEGPASVPAGQPFDVRVFWNEPAMQAGETWYGAFSLGTDPANPGNLGTIFVNVIREGDDVFKNAFPSVASPGDTVSYEIVVDTNVTAEALTYAIQDTIPAGLTYVPGSATATTGTVEVNGNVLTWTGVMPPESSVQGRYTITSNQADSTCATPFGGYYDVLTGEGFPTDPGLFGDTINWFYNSFAGTDFYGAKRAAPPLFTDDGIVVFGEYAGQPWVNQNIPDPAPPNGLFAPYWRDMEVVYDEAANKGVTAVNYDDFWLVEIDDIQAFEDPTTTLDYEVIVWKDALPGVATSPGLYDAYYAFDNVNVADTLGTIGVEDDAGVRATQFSFDNFTPTNGLVICLDYLGATPAVITYDVTVNEDAEGVLTNQVVHNTDNPGSQPVTTSADLTIERNDVLFLSLSNSARLSGHSTRDEDILAYNFVTGEWSKFFDGSDVGVHDNDVNAFAFDENDDILLSFNESEDMDDDDGFDGPDRIDDADIYRFVATLLGEDTAGNFELYFDGSDVGLTTDGEDIDAIFLIPGVGLLISTLGSYEVPGPDGTEIRGKDEDLLLFVPTSLGEDTAGSWELVLDGSEEGLGDPDEDISGVWMNLFGDQLFLTSRGGFSVEGASGDSADIFTCTIPGATSLCSFSPDLDGATIGLDGERIDGFAYGSLSGLASVTSAEASDATDELPEVDEDANDDVADEEEEAQNSKIFLPIVRE